MHNSPARKRPRPTALSGPPPGPAPAPPSRGQPLPADPLATFAIESPLPSTLRLAAETGTSIGTAHLAWALRSVEQSLRSLYMASRMAWNLRSKRGEFRHPDQRFILVLPADSPPLMPPLGSGAGAPSLRPARRKPPVPMAFVAYRAEKADPTVEAEGEPRNAKLLTVLYVYELFVSESLRGSGVATSLMRLVEQIGTRFGLSKVVLTVFDENLPAKRLYMSRLGYIVDGSSPSKWGVVNAKYEILSKKLLDT